MFTITDNTRLQVGPVLLDMTTLRQLERVCINGLPDALSESLCEALLTLVCLSINPMRPLPATKEG